MSTIEQLKQQAAAKAVEAVHSGMTVGLGTGSTSRYAVIKIGQLWQTGELTDIIAVPTSEQTAQLAREYSIPLSTLDEHPLLDVAIDGADDVDPDLNLIKGLGGALMREKITEVAGKRLIIIVDERKLVDKLGQRSPLPVEVTQFASQAHVRWLSTLGCEAVLRQDSAGAPYVTDNGNYIIDCHFAAGIDQPHQLARALADRPGILEHGLFLDMADEVIIASASGIERKVRASTGSPIERSETQQFSV